MNDRLFLDTNVILDLLGERDIFYDAIARIVSLADKGAMSSSPGMRKISRRLTSP